MSFEPQSIGDFLDEMYDLHMDEHAFGWQYNMLWKLLGIEGVPQLPDGQSFLVGTFPDYYEHVTAARSRFSLAELRQNVHDYKPTIHLQGGLAQKMRSAYGSGTDEDAIRRHASLAGAALPPAVKKAATLTGDDFKGPVVDFSKVFGRTHVGPGLRAGSNAHFDLLMPKTPADDMNDRDFVLMLCQVRSVAEPEEQLIYGYLYNRLEDIAKITLAGGFPRSNVKYRMDKFTNIDEVLQKAREVVVRSTKPTLRVVSNGEG